LVALGAAALDRWIRQRGSPPAALIVVAAIVCGIALAGAIPVHLAAKFDKEDWRGLAVFLQSRGVASDSLSLSESEITLPLSYYFDQERMDEGFQRIPACGRECWWISRQPYTATHALTQFVRERRDLTLPALPVGCREDDAWVSGTGVSAIHVVCSSP